MTVLIIEAALRGLLFAAVVGAGLSLLRVKHVPVRKAAWSLVLIASMAMPFLMRWPMLAGLRGKLAWAVPIRMNAAIAPRASAPVITALPVPETPAQEPASTAPMRIDPSTTAPAITDSLPITDTSTPAQTQLPAPAPTRQFTWPPISRVALWTYLPIATALLLRLLIGLAFALRLWLTADAVSPLVAPEGNVRASKRVASPVTVGSGIVLPADYPRWERSRLQMVLAHEQSHVRQMDFWLQLLAGLYTATFWFSPLGWWLRRRLAQLAEAISDLAGMEAAQSGSDYAQVVLEFAALPRRRLPGVAMASGGNLSRRIDSLLNESRFRRAFAEGRRRALASLLLIPAALFAATVLIRVPAAAAQAAQASSSPKGAPVTSGPRNLPLLPGTASAAPRSGPVQAPRTPDATSTGQAFAGQGPNAGQVLGSEQQVPRPPPATAPPATGPITIPPAIAPPALPPPPPSMASGEGQGSGAGAGQSPRGSETTIISRHENGSNSSGFAYHALPDGNAWAVASGSWSDADLPSSFSASRRAELERAHRTAKGPFLWFTRNGKSYLITDPVVLAKIEAQFEAIRNLGMQQRLIGQTQENLGKQQEAMALLQKEAAAGRIPNMQDLMPQIEESIEQAQKEMQEWTPQRMAALQAELKAELSPEKLNAMEAELSKAQGKLTPEVVAQIQRNLKTELSPAKMVEIDAKWKAAEADWNAQSLAKLQASLAEAQARLAQAQAEMDARQAEFGARMGRLGEQMGQLGEKQGRLGAEQGRLSQKLNQQVQQIIQQSLANGTARVVQ
jgi:hypothetical protein